MSINMEMGIQFQLKNVFSEVIIHISNSCRIILTLSGCWKVIDKCIQNMICQGVRFLVGMNSYWNSLSGQGVHLLG